MLLNPRFSQILFFCITVTFLSSCSKDKVVSDSEQEELQIDHAARLTAKKLYEDYYLASKSKSSDVFWTGDEPSCNPGTVPEGTKNKILQRINYYRIATGLNNAINENATKSEKAQQAALMMHANNTLDHIPPNSWKCFSDSGKEGAGNSLLTMTKNAEAIDSYIRDQGSDNGPVGHRRWLLWPRLQEIGIGNTDKANAIWVLGNAGAVSSDNPEFIAWPPMGYVPDQVVYPRWSFSIKDADFTATKVSMKDNNGKTISLSVEELNNQFGDKTIVWVPEEISANIMEDDVSYTVTLKDVEINGTLKDFEYIVVLFDADN